ncbi:hypothetical protein [Marinicrinis lubricantis]|uniref:Uncharacterized protein n=1 Tax=Marinicrinis lubricantis TaxID=2086470 RepID=A0ABW1ITA5_9BACL
MTFDPTIYDNLKVVLEGAVYELDIEGVIQILNRSDNIHLSTMSRSYSIQFALKHSLHEPKVTATIVLEASLHDLAGELLAKPNESLAAFGCELSIAFEKELFLKDEMPLRELSKYTEEGSMFMLAEIWGEEGRHYTREWFLRAAEKGNIEAVETVQVHFDRTVNEMQMDDFPELIQHVITSLERLDIPAT